MSFYMYEHIIEGYQNQVSDELLTFDYKSLNVNLRLILLTWVSKQLSDA